MKIFQFIYNALVIVLFSSADPNLFGSQKRRKEKQSMAAEFKGYAAQTQDEIDALKTQNPFESAAAKSAMAASSRKSKQLQQRYSNMLGGNNNPEAIIAAQAATQEAVAGTAGDIAVGAEAMKKTEIGQLRGEKTALLGQASGLQQSAINERGTGWRDFYATFMNPLAGGIKGGMQGAQQ